MKPMDIYSRPGTTIYFLNKNGYDSQRKEAAEIFLEGQALTVKRMDVGDSSSRVEFKELPGKWFNTVMFGTPEEPVVIGENPLPKDVQEKLGEFLDWLDVNYETDQGTTAMFWSLSYEIANRLVKK